MKTIALILVASYEAVFGVWLYWSGRTESNYVSLGLGELFLVLAVTLVAAGGVEAVLRRFTRHPLEDP